MVGLEGSFVVAFYSHMHENCHKPLMFRCALNRCCHFCLLVFQWLVCRLVPPSDVGCTWYQLRSRHREQGRKTSTKERHSSSNTKSSFSVIFFLNWFPLPFTLAYLLFLILYIIRVYICCSLNRVMKSVHVLY